MPEQDKERALRGNTVEDQDRSKIEAVITNIDQYIRERKGLSSKPEQFDVKVISQLSDVAVIDDPSPAEGSNQPIVKIYNEGHLSLPEFARRLRLKRSSQLKNQPKEKAA